MAAKKSAKPRPAARKYDRKTVVPKICARLSEGEPLAQICRDMKISWETQKKWRKTDQWVSEKFDDARDRGYDAIAHRLRETARKRGDTTEDVARDKLIIETDLKLLAKWDPRRYGDKQIIAGDKDNPVHVRSTRDMSEADLLAIAAQGRKASISGESDG